VTDDRISGTAKNIGGQVECVCAHIWGAAKDARCCFSEGDD